MPSQLLTKGDFKASFDCRTKLFYRKNGYPTNLDENEYLRFLADGGFMVEFIAKARFRDGIDLAAERDPTAAAVKTRQLMNDRDVVLFEAAATVRKYHIRSDILKKHGRVLDLIEVKSSSIADDEEDDAVSPFLTKRGRVVARWRECLLDIAFQTYVLRLAFPEATVRPFLCVVNKSQVAGEADTLANFQLTKNPHDPKGRPTVQYTGNIEQLRNSNLLSIRSTENEVELLLPEAIAKAEALAALLGDKAVDRIQEDIARTYRICRQCEYRGIERETDGFRECWANLADAPSHVLDLHRVGQIGTTKVEDPVPRLLQSGSASFADLAEADLGNPGSYQARRLMQWQSMRNGGLEHLPCELKAELATHGASPGYPLHFIDFEACNLALPHHAGLKPYERVAFQWSCHTVDSHGVLTHREWLNTTREFPNFAFVRTLCECLGETGTVYVWSPYEQVTLRKVRQQISDLGLPRKSGHQFRRF